MLHVDELFVTQKKIRNPEQLARMIEYVQSGGFFTKNCLSKHKNREKISPLIEVTLFEDGRHFLHDGHHRAASIVLGNRDFLDTTEYRVRKFNYEDYLHPNLVAEWWTPFDVLTTVRLADMTEYKDLINELIAQNVDNSVILNAIEHNKHLYIENRDSILTLHDFVGAWRDLKKC